MRSTFLVLIWLTFAGCTTVRIASTYDPTVDFNGYRTFCWLEGCDYQYQGDLDSIAVVEVKMAIEEELMRKGLVKDENDPQILVDFNVWVTEDEYLKAHFESDYDFWPTYEKESYAEGSLVIGIADRRTSTMIWQSTTRKYLDPSQQPNLKAMRRVVHRSLAGFPPKGTKAKN